MTKFKFWTEEEDQYVEQNYPNMPTVKLAAQLKRTAKSVQLRASILGIKKKVKAQRQYKRLTAVKRFTKQDRNVTLNVPANFNGTLTLNFVS